jgi:hypothetical protein
LGNGDVLVVGGHEGPYSWESPALVTRARLYQPATNQFLVTGAMIWPRAGHSATTLADGRVMIFGGEGDSRWPERGEIFDPSTGSFAATVAAASGRVEHTATLLLSGQVLITGGRAGSSVISSFASAPSILFQP